MIFRVVWCVCGICGIFLRFILFHFFHLHMVSPVFSQWTFYEPLFFRSVSCNRMSMHIFLFFEELLPSEFFLKCSYLLLECSFNSFPLPSFFLFFYFFYYCFLYLYFSQNVRIGFFSRDEQLAISFFRCARQDIEGSNDIHKEGPGCDSYGSLGVV